MLTNKDIQLLRREFFDPLNNRLDKVELRLGNIEIVLTDHSKQLILLNESVNQIDFFIHKTLFPFLRSLENASVRHDQLLTSQKKKLNTFNI